jgi:hypothetical protein
MVALLKSPDRLDRLSLADVDRRVFPRSEVHCRVQGRRLDHSVTAHRSPFLSLYTRDVSLGGLAALTDKPLDPGERISIFFPPQGSQRGWDAYGRVIRCEPSATGWRMAMEFDPLPAA